MFVSIELQNFYSFSKNELFSMEAESICEFKNSIIYWSRNKTDEVNTVPLHVMLGDNNTGKSNILTGMKLMKAILSNGCITKDMVSAQTAYAGNSDKPIVLKMSFIENKKLFEYEVAFLAGDTITIEREVLVVNRATVFTRTGDKVLLAGNRKATMYFDNGKALSSEKQEKTKLSIQANELYVTGPFRYTVAYHLVSDMLLFANTNFIIMDELPQDTSIRYRDEIQNLIKTIGYDCDLDNLDNASKGTKRFIQLCDYIFDALATKKTLVIDEMDNGMQANLIMMVTSMFHNHKYNKLGAQLIFTTSNPLYLDNDYIRRDEVTFITKEKQSTKCTSLLTYAKRESNYLRKYITHEYDVLPVRNMKYFLANM